MICSIQVVWRVVFKMALNMPCQEAIMYKSVRVLLSALILLTLLLGSVPVSTVHAATTWTVTTSANSGPGSLRQAMLDAGDGDTIVFNAGYTITLGSQLPIVTGKAITITGNGTANTIIQASICNPVTKPGNCTPAAYRVFEVGSASGSSLTLENLTVRYGDSSASGGGIRNEGTLTITHSAVSDNSASASFGGGIYNSGTLTVTDSTISGNSAGGVGGGIVNDGGTMTVTNSVISGNFAGTDGGGIRNSDTLTIIDSTISGNSAGGGGGGIYSSSGALAVTNSTIWDNSALTSPGGGIFNSGTLIAANSTFSGNSAAASHGGGAFNSGTLGTTNSTFSGNSAGGNGSGIYNSFNLHLKNTILAGSPSGEDCYNLNGDAIAINVDNLIETNGATGHMCGTPAFTADPKLGPLSSNGGPTRTHALLSGSPAIDEGDTTTCSLAVGSPDYGAGGLDQRGVSRSSGGKCDIGAYEYDVNEQAGPNFVVNTDADTDDGFCFLSGHGPGNQDCTLREAINAANVLAGANGITFDDNYVITLGSQLPVITTEMTITGEGAANTILQANASPNVAAYRVLQVGSAGDLTIDGLTVRHGNGGILNEGTLVVTNSAIEANSADSGGGILNRDTLTATNSVFSDNSAKWGGGVYNDGGVITVTDSAFSSNSADTSGGGIFNEGTLAVSSGAFSGNAADNGGGVFNNGVLTVTNSAFSGNAADNGGGIYNDAGALTVTNSTFSNNSVVDGGGLYNASGALTLANSTFSGNSASDRGGGIFNLGVSATLRVTNVTVSGNGANVSGGGLYNSGGSVFLANTILANSSAGGDCATTVAFAYNFSSLIEDKSCGNTAALSGDPKLGPLADNGGPTRTHALLVGSPAIDAGNDTTCNNAVGSPAYGAGGLDQRGETRPFGSHCDIGAFEFVNHAPTGISLSNNSVDENQVVGTTVGTFSTTDPDAGDSHAYTFCGGMDDASFTIEGDTLKTAVVFDYETKSRYSICIRSTDSTGLSVTSTFAIDVNDLFDTPTFADVSITYWAWDFIERLYNAGITGGCSTSPLNYCPEDPVTRAQMAVFLERGVHYPAVFTAPDVTPTFSDTVGHWAEDWIEALKNDGITAGCAIGLYCPEDPVTRAQMAVFLLKAKHGSSYSPPDIGAGTGFGDVPTDHWAAAWIKQLAAESITGGCGGGNYCPEDPVTRAQMAVFLVRTFNLP